MAESARVSYQAQASSTSFGLASAGTVQHAQGISTNYGNVILAGRDVILQSHRYSPSQLTISILDVLGLVPNLRGIHLDVLSKATHGTGLWFLKTKDYLLWIEPDGTLKILWGTGIPGAGKTVMASIVINDLEARAAAAGGTICVAYIYFRYSDAVSLTVRGILEILVKQIVERHPDCASMAEEVYARHLRERTQPTEAELLDLLRQFTEAKAVTFYVLDALDEAPEGLRVALIKKLTTLNVRLFITSRPLKDVEGRFPHASRFPIAAQDGDLDIHIEQEIANSSVLEELLGEAEEAFKHEMVSLVKKNCGGMFLHASLQLDAISRCTSTQDVVETLEGFPSEIEDVYRDAWKRICRHTPKNIALTKRVLIWVLNAARSMTIEEIRHAIATSPDTHKFERKRLVPAATLLTLCCGLIVVEEETKIVRLLHYTAKSTLQELLHDDFPHPHSLLATVCMTHLIECGFQNTTISSEDGYAAALQSDPLLAYASPSWATHARESLEIAEVRRQTAAFVSGCLALPCIVVGEHLRDFDILGPLHLVALHHLPINLLHNEHFEEPNLVTKIVKDVPLKLASWSGNEEMVQELLRLPTIDINYVDRDGTSALMLAAEEGHESIVELLIDHPDIQVNTVDKCNRTALVSSAQYGYEGIVAALLAHRDIRVNVLNTTGWSALMVAITHGHEGVVKLLLAHPDTNVNAETPGRLTALMEAIITGHEGIVNLLLSRPEIDINSVDGSRFSALLWAVARNSERAVQALLKCSGINVNQTNINGWSPLLWATVEDREGIVQLLLAHPEINVNLANEATSGCTPLIEACRHNRTRITGLLLEHSEIDINTVDFEGRSALWWMAEGGRNAIGRLLLAHPGIQVNADGWTALSCAIAKGHKDTITLLLAHPSIDVNLANTVIQPGWTGLMEAAIRGDEEIVQVLLERSEIQVNMLDHRGRSALVIAARKGHEDVVKLLLAHPKVDVNVVDNDGRSALMWAFDEGHENVTRCLLAHPSIQVDTANLAAGVSQKLP